jgi:hypothetical protein
MALQHLRSSTADKRPTPAAMSDGQLALNTNLVSPGLFFKDSNGDSVKIGPVHVGTTAPNVTPGAGGQAGNSKGEQWLDTSSSRYVFKIWDGTAWRSEDGEFVNASGDTMTGALVMDNQQQVRFRETTANGTNFIAIEAPASVTADRTLTLPDVTGTIVSTGDTGSVTSTMILDGTILNADINASAAIVDTKLDTIATAGKVSNSATTATDANTASTIVARSAAGNFNITSINNGPLAGMRNAIINGNFDIWQRGTSFTGSEHGADRWLSFRVGTTHTATRQAFTLGQTDVPGEPTYFIRTVVSSVAGAANASLLQQRIEDVRSFAGQQVTASFWAKADASKPIAIEFAQSFGTGGSPSAGVESIGVTKVTLSTSWQKVTVTANIPSINGKTLGSDNNSRLGLLIYFDAGSDFNARTDTLGQQSGTFEIAQVQIEPGPVATPFEQRPIGTELALCQRYFCSTIFNNRFDATIGGSINESAIYWPVQMRVAPTVTLNTTNIVNATAIASAPSVNGARSELAAVAAGNARLLDAPVTASAEF